MTRKMRHRLIALFMSGLLAGLLPVHASQPLDLRGELTQGSLLRGKLAPSGEIRLGAELNSAQIIAVNENGHFAFGFGRDAALEHKLWWRESKQSEWQSRLLRLSKRAYKTDNIEGVAQKYVAPPKEVSARIRSDNRLVANARAVTSEFDFFTQAFIRPAQGRISGVYGSQRIFNGVPKRPHYGLDIAAPIGTSVIAPAAGVVSLVHADMYYSGGTLIIDHGMGVSSTFIHLDSILVQEGQTVEQGEPIATIGATGRVTGAHLDWRVNWFKTRLDPALLLTD